MLHRTVGEKTAPLLFSLEVELEQYDGDVLDKGAQTFALKNGIAFAGKEVAVRIADSVWEYITRFGTPDTMTRTGYNTFSVSVCGEADRSLIVPASDKRPYEYDCVSSKKFPFMLPYEEYQCTLSDCDDHFNVYVDGIKVGTYIDKKNRGKLDVIRKQLGYGWRTTASLQPWLGSCVVRVHIVKA